MDEDELSAIEARYAAADKVAPMSQWKMIDTECNCDCGHVRFDDDDNDIEIDCESGECADCLKELRANQSGFLTQTDGEYWYFHPRTLMFILACRADIPALVAEVRRLQGEVNRIAELEAECAALREALSSAAYYYEPATTVLAQSDAGSALLKRLQAAEAVCEAFENGFRTDAAYVRAKTLLKAWLKAKGE